MPLSVLRSTTLRATQGQQAPAPAGASTGLKPCGAGRWLAGRRSTKSHPSWRRLHIGPDAGTGQIVAAALTAAEGDDAAEVGPLLT